MRPILRLVMRLGSTSLVCICAIVGTLTCIDASAAFAAQEAAAQDATTPTTTTEAPAVAATEAPATVAPVENVPARGLTMEQVEAKFGAPTQKLDAVGKPPITRWEYPGYVVYFEREYVLHTVAK